MGGSIIIFRQGYYLKKLDTYGKVKIKKGENYERIKRSKQVLCKQRENGRT